MIEPSHLLEQAEKLIDGARGAPRQADLRRSISASYYALFHTILRQCALAVAGGGPWTPEYRIVYRSIEHRTVKEVCADAAKPLLPERIRTLFHREQFSVELRSAAFVFGGLQEERHIADYDPAPTERIVKERALKAIGSAQAAMESIERLPKEELGQFAYLVCFRARP